MHSPGPPAQPPPGDRGRLPIRGRSGTGRRRTPRRAGGAPSFRTRMLLTGIAGGVVAVLAAVTAATGGFASEGSGPDQVPVGRTIDQVHFTTQVLGASWVTEKLGTHRYRNMAARMRVTNTGDRPATLIEYTKSVIPLQAWGGALLAAQGKAYTGGTETDELTPGIPTDVVVQYTPNTGEQHAKQLSLRFCSYEHRSEFYYTGHQIWATECDSWGSFDPREMVGPKDITAPGLSKAQIAAKARALNAQGTAARKKKVFNPEGIVAQVNIPLKGGA